MIVSSEQQLITDTIRTNNVIVSAVAGSGKTHTCIHIGASNPDKRTLIITYNAMLKMETRKKAAKYTNIEVHSFHSFVNKYYGVCANDEDMERILTRNSISTSNNYDYILIDEVQDMTILYYRLVCKIITEITTEPRICVLGDPRQEINAYKGADSRYLTMFDKLIGRDNFVHLTLSTSFRLTKEIAEFVVGNMYRDKIVINTIKEGLIPFYYIVNTHNPIILYNTVFRNLNTAFDEIFVLGTTLGNENTPITKFANELTRNGVDIFRANGCERLEEDTMRGKVCISSFHQTKGMERDVVIVFGFDESYYYNREPTQECPNELYVAATRAKKLLILIHDESHQHLPFLMRPTYAIGKQRNLIRKRVDYERRKAITSFIKHIEPNVLRTIMDMIEVRVIRAPGSIIKITNKVAQIGSDGRVMVEPVSDINGIAIPLYFQKNYETGMNLAPEYMLKQATDLSTKSTGYTYRSRQITSFKWITEETFLRCNERLHSLFDGNLCYDTKDKLPSKNKLVFEQEVRNESPALIGAIDCYNAEKNEIYEFKCVSALSPEHHIQLVLYQYMLGTNPTAFLYNVLNDNLVEVSCKNPNKIITMIGANNAHISDADFIRANQMIL